MTYQIPQFEPEESLSPSSLPSDSVPMSEYYWSTLPSAWKTVQCIQEFYNQKPPSDQSKYDLIPKKAHVDGGPTASSFVEPLLFKDESILVEMGPPSPPPPCIQKLDGFSHGPKRFHLKRTFDQISQDE
jgi:hypothetical protein